MTTGSEFLVEHKEFDPHAGQLLITTNIQSIVAVSALSAFPTIAVIVPIFQRGPGPCEPAPRCPVLTDPSGTKTSHLTPNTQTPNRGGFFGGCWEVET